MSMKDLIFSMIMEKLEASSSETIDEKATNPYAIGMAAAMKSTGDEPPLKKSTITKAHKIAKSIEKNEEVEIDEAKEFSTWHAQHPTKPSKSYKVTARTAGEALKKAHKAAITAGDMKSNVADTVWQSKHIKKIDEEVEQIDEISQEKLRDYHAKAGADRLNAKAVVQKVLNTKKPAMSSIDKASSAYKRFQKRGAGMTMAANKMDEEAELDEAKLSSQQRDRLDHLIDMAAETSSPEYMGNENTSKYINLIKKEFGDSIAKQVDDGLDKMHWGRDNQSGGMDKLASRQWSSKFKGGPRVTAAGKMNKQDVSALKNRIKTDKKSFGGIAKKANLPEEVELDEAVNAKKVIADHDAGHSIDVIVQKHLNKKADNKDEILKIIRNNAWNKRIKK